VHFRHFFPTGPKELLMSKPSARALLVTAAILLVPLLGPVGSSADAASLSSASVPSTVEGLAAHSITATGATISWDPVPTAARYRVYWSTSSSMPSACEPNCKVITPSSLSSPSTTLKDLPAGKTHYVKVSALNAAGKTITGWQTTPLKVSLASSTVAIPTSVQGLTASDLATTGATISWDPVPTAARYRVYWSTSSSMPSACEPHCKLITPSSLSSPSQTLAQILSPTTPRAAGTYYLKVSALNAAGKTITGWQTTPLKVTLPATTTTIPASVQGLTATNLTTTDATISWDPVPTAARYRVYWSTSSSMPSACEPHCKLITPSSTSSPSQTLAQILSPTTPRAAGTYYLKVSALNAAGKTITGWQSAPLKVVLPNVASAAPTGLRAVTASASSLSLDWNDVSDAPQYRIQLSTSANMADSVYYRFTASEGVVEDLAKATTYYLKVRVISAAGDNLSDYSEAVQAKTLAVDGIPLDIASFNVKCQSCYPTNAADRGPKELPWVDRRQAVVDTILSRRPDVIGIQEASQAWLIENGKQVNLSQFEDLRNRLKATGGTYELANANRNNCVKSTTPSNCVVKDQGASKGTKILYDTAKLTLVRQGSNGLARASSSGQERFVAWAVFTQKASGQQFFFATTHLEPGTQYHDLRQTQAGQVVRAIDAANTTDLPVMLVGDMNSTRYATPTNAPFDAFVASGLVDPLGTTYKSPEVSSTATAEKRVHANYNSFNGFVPAQKRYAQAENGSNLDYMLTSPMQVKQWETVVNLDSSGNLTGIIPSDHNMLTAEVVLPR
jgi:endonuclease/exonuclease/phosphatase family metal-dependent hydrolase